MKPIIRKYVQILTISMMFIFSVINCQAHRTSGEHNKDLEKIIFETGFSKYKSTNVRKYVDAIEKASQLTVDQYGGDNEEDFNQLKRDVSGLTLNFKSIDYSRDPVDGKTAIVPTNHRRYTHEGWERTYENKAVRKFWENRKSVLLATTNWILEYDNETLITGYNEKVKAFSGIVYYIHLLGDYDEADNYKKISVLADLGGDESIDAVKYKYCVIPSIKRYSEILFKETSDDECERFIKELDKLEKEASKIENTVGGVNNEKEFQEYKIILDSLFECLKKYMPKLLKKESHFKKAFYPEL